MATDLETYLDRVGPDELLAWTKLWTPRQREVAEALPGPYDVIGKHLGISRSTVEWHVTQMCDKIPAYDPQRAQGAGQLASVKQKFSEAKSLALLVRWAYERTNKEALDPILWFETPLETNDLPNRLLDRLERATPHPHVSVIRALARVNENAAEEELDRMPEQSRFQALPHFLQGLASQRTTATDARCAKEAPKIAAAIQTIDSEALKVVAYAALGVACVDTAPDQSVTYFGQASQSLRTLGPSVERVHAKAELAVAFVQSEGPASKRANDMAQKAFDESRELTARPVDKAGAVAAAGRALIATGNEDKANQAVEFVRSLLEKAESDREKGAMHLAVISISVEMKEDSHPSPAEELESIVAPEEKSDARATIAIADIKTSKQPKLFSEPDLLVASIKDVLLPRDAARVLAAASERNFFAGAREIAHVLATGAAEMARTQLDAHLPMHTLAALAKQLDLRNKTQPAKAIREKVRELAGLLSDHVQRAHVLAALAGSSSADDRESAIRYAKEAYDLMSSRHTASKERAHLLARLACISLGSAPDYLTEAVAASDDMVDGAEKMRALLAIAEGYKTLSFSDKANAVVKEVVSGSAADLVTACWIRVEALQIALRIDTEVKVAEDLLEPIAIDGIRTVGWAKAALVFAEEENIHAYKSALGPAEKPLLDSVMRSYALEALAKARVVLGHSLHDYRAALAHAEPLDGAEAANVLAVLANELCGKAEWEGYAAATLVQMTVRAEHYAHMLGLFGVASQALVAMLPEDQLNKLVDRLKSLSQS